MKIKGKPENLFFEFLFNLANSDIESMENSVLVSLLYEYSRYMGELADKYSLISRDRYAQIMTGVGSDENALTERRQGVLQLQKRLQDIFDGIMSPAEKPLIKMQGYQDVSIDNNRQFVFQFIPTKIKSKKFDWNIEKVLLDVFFMDLIRELDLLPERFLKCTKCSSYFYQYSAKEKIYCSIRCGNADRQRKLQPKKKKAAKK